MQSTQQQKDLIWTKFVRVLVHEVLCTYDRINYLIGSSFLKISKRCNHVDSRMHSFWCVPYQKREHLGCKGSFGQSSDASSSKCDETVLPREGFRPYVWRGQASRDAKFSAGKDRRKILSISFSSKNIVRVCGCARLNKNNESRGRSFKTSSKT